MSYPDRFKIVEEKVRPERSKLKDNSDGKRRKEYWWQYADGNTRAQPRHRWAWSGYWSNQKSDNKLSFPSWFPEWVFSHMLIVFAIDDFATIRFCNRLFILRSGF